MNPVPLPCEQLTSEAAAAQEQLQASTASLSAELAASQQELATQAIAAGEHLHAATADLSAALALCQSELAVLQAQAIPLQAQCRELQDRIMCMTPIVSKAHINDQVCSVVSAFQSMLQSPDYPAT